MNVIFLDIDGVMKPSRCYFKKDGDHLGDFDPLAVDAVNRICEKANAMIVFNTYWNTQENLKEIAVGQGIKEEYILGKTRYPHNLRGLDDYPNRLTAINTFLTENPEIKKWIALDDEEILDDNAIWVDYENGITVENYRTAVKKLGYEDHFICLM